MEMTLDYEATRQFVETHTWDQLLEALELKASIRFQRAFELYSVSMDWFKIGPQFILKAKGARGDLLVSWS